MLLDPHGQSGAIDSALAAAQIRRGLPWSHGRDLGGPCEQRAKLLYSGPELCTLVPASLLC